MFGETKEEKAARKEAKEQEKIRAILGKYGVEDIDPKYVGAVKEISAELTGAGLSEAGNLLSPNQRTANQITIQFLNAIFQQNWIIIRELSDIEKSIREIPGK